MSKIKKVLIFVIIVLVFTLILFLYKNFNRTVYNDENAAGNTSGNLFNEGLFSELNGKIYFSNSNDDGTLYQMDLKLDNFKKIYSDKVGYINAVGKYIYYVRMNYLKKNSSSSVFSFNNKGIYRINHKGNGIKLLYDNPSGLINVHGNNVYYQHYNQKEGLTFYSVGIDGSNEKMISDEAIIPISIVNNELYYSGTSQDHNIYKMDITSNISDMVYSGNTYAPIVCNDYIYYMSVDNNYQIYRINLDGSNPTPVVQERVSTFNITSDGMSLYYQIDDNKKNGINMMNLQTGEAVTLMEGNFKQINVAGGYVFFRDYKETKTYYIPVGVSIGISTFNPPDLGK